jgi:hypothetical protein
MATVANQPGIDEDKDKEGVNLGAPAPTIGGGTAPSGGGVSSAAASTPGAITGGQKAATSSGSYSDVGRYLKANKPRIGQYANQIAGKVSDRVNEADIATQEEVSGIQGDIDAAKLPGTDFYKGKDVTNLDVGKSQELLSGGWKGPSAEDVALSTLSELEGARDLANLSGSYTGSKELIDQTMQPSDGRYTRGMTSLGAASLRGDTNARGILAQSRSSAEDAYTSGVASQEDLEENVAQGIEANKQAGENFADWLKNYEQGINTSAIQAEDARQAATKASGQQALDVVKAQMAKESAWKGSSDYDRMMELRRRKSLAGRYPLTTVFFNEALGAELAALEAKEQEVFGGRQAVSDAFGGREVTDIPLALQIAIAAGYDLDDVGSKGIGYSGLSADQAGQLEALQNIGQGTLGLGADTTTSRFDQTAANQRYLDNLYNYLFGQ